MPREDEGDLWQRIECKICGGVFGVMVYDDSPNEGLFWIGRVIWDHEEKHTKEEKAAVILRNDKYPYSRYIMTEEEPREWEAPFGL